MSFVVTIPEALAAVATDLAGIGSTIGTANAAAAVPTTTVLAAAADEVSAAMAALFSGHAQAYQALSAQAALFHEQFVRALVASGSASGGGDRFGGYRVDDRHRQRGRRGPDHDGVGRRRR